ncbi:anthocyanidin 5,3-O-glucosyltransferase-like [Dioscorea cayenensis subsp. rotundata]|uniref:Anthocyanidin 5,3-O-glucosyltransferase-like n=1 Tax=Dioscorea cayennensis subsp. rotundata TaxID=55577 RepID=A0AB40AQC8_DIOCR|nr:anthocyanidin 5,3-O-glucosyltransferase-like [Dioscorea cayenensis subsp. rotundata]
MDTVVFYPAPGIGHLAPMTEFAKLLVAQGFSVDIAILPPMYPSVSTSDTDDYMTRISSSHPSITFHRLPPFTVHQSSTHIAVRFLSELRAANPLLRDLLQSISQTSNIRAILTDFFCMDVLDVAADLQLPAYVFFTCSAFILAYFLYLPTLYSEMTCGPSELGETPIHIPGVPPIPASHMPDLMRDRDEGLQTFVNLFSRLPDAKGIILNSFEFLESRTLKTVRGGHCLPNRETPPVYCAGPLIKESGGGGGERHECLTWLDKQPKGSVVFLCFGSRGRFTAEQVNEIATGLERSDQRFVWVVRSPPDPENRLATSNEVDLDTLLPVGFLERTEGRGVVVKDWAPQVEVLNHEATGVFVTHCGWNSVLEGLLAGVGLIAWPLYAEQKMNKVVLVDEMKLAVELKGYDKGKVAAEEVENRLRWLMQSDGGAELRNRAKEMKDHAMAALSDGGSSHAAVLELVSLWKKQR